MAENGADPQIDSDAEYRWYPPDLQKLASTILDVLIRGFAPPDHFTGSIGKEGPPRERIRPPNGLRNSVDLPIQ